MGLRSGLPHLGSPRRCVADLAAPIQLAPAAQQSKIKSAHQPPRSYRGQPVEAPHLDGRTGNCARPSRDPFYPNSELLPNGGIPPYAGAWWSTTSAVGLPMFA